MKRQNGQTKNDGNNNKTRKVVKTLSIGSFAGLFWGLISLLLYYLQLTDVGTSIYAKPVLNPDYLLKWQGHLIGLFFFILFSLAISFIYLLLFIRFKSPWIGVMYGIGLWVFVFILLNSLYPLTKPITELGVNTNSTMLSLYTLIGLFIGYSLSVEFNNEDKQRDS